MYEGDYRRWGVVGEGLPEAVPGFDAEDSRDKSSGTFDVVIDFDQILRDPATPSQLSSKYNGGDYLHPNVAGYQALADAFPLDIFTKFAGTA